MKSIWKTIKINSLTYFLFFICLLSGLFKNVLIIFLILFVHEMGHIFFISRFNYRIIKVEFFPFGGITKIEKDINSPINHELLIAIGGFLFQLLLSLIFLILFNLGFINGSTFHLFNGYNNAIIFFNLLPIIPLDGSILLRSILEKFLTFKLSYFLSIIISAIGIFFYIQLNYLYSINNYIIVSLLAFKLVEYIKNYKYIYNQFLIERYLKIYDFKKIKKEKNINYKKFRKETLHFFKVGEKYIHEREVLSYLFDKKRHFWYN